MKSYSEICSQWNKAYYYCLLLGTKESLKLSEKIKEELKDDFVKPTEYVKVVTSDAEKTELQCKLVSVVTDSLDLYENEQAVKVYKLENSINLLRKMIDHYQEYHKERFADLKKMYPVGDTFPEFRVNHAAGQLSDEKRKQEIQILSKEPVNSESDRLDSDVVSKDGGP